ncbi:MAG: hypothetical protein P1U87_00690 [Verrucomicrobiales bacterium]|nr:hypothetical protein [Verrucomicrobiales bacterium]
MKRKLPFLIAILLIGFPAFSSEVIDEIDGIVLIESESTGSPLGKWKKKTDLDGFRGDAYLEFTGNSPTNGPSTSPLTFRFRISKGGLYYLHLRCAREKVGDRNDLANDGYVRLEGDLGTGPNPGDKHGADAPLEMLKKDTKFFGGNDRKFVWASGNRLDPGGHNNKRVAVYSLKAGGEYTLVLSGRSQKFKVDQILFRHEEVPAKEAEK